MRICVVIPSDAFASSAGMRIRYERLATGAAILGAEISAVPIGDLKTKSDLVHDAYLFAKTYSAHSYVLAHRMRELGKLTGVDIFDDYFTQAQDSRLGRYRAWLKTMSGLIDFALCSTPRLEQALHRLVPDVPVAVVADPSPAYDPRLVAFLAAHKHAEARQARRLRVLWFGIGDNPYFPVGLRDLVAFGGELARLNRHGWSAELTVLTNQRALTADGLNLLRRLPIPYSLQEWTPEIEEAALNRHDVCFLPVNGQEFSRAKSLNRAVSALVAGCQVLSVGYPLYEPLSEFVYRSADALLADFMAGRPALRPEIVPVLTERLSALANPYSGAETVAALLREKQAAAPTALSAYEKLPSLGVVSSPQNFKSIIKTGFRTSLGIIHGAVTDNSLHKLAQTLGGLSVKGPLCRERWNFDVRFDCSETTGEIRILLAEQMVGLLSAEHRKALVPFGAIADRTFHEISGSAASSSLPAAKLLVEPSPIRNAAAAPWLMPAVMASCRRLFPTISFYLSERSTLLAQYSDAA